LGAARQAVGGAPAPLGTIAKFVAKKKIAEAALAAVASADVGARRFMRQSVARDLVPDERVAICLRRPIPGAPGVELWRDPKHAAAHYKQLQVCGSVWMCAVCGARISEVRRVELSAAIKAWPGQVVFITLTLQHDALDPVSEVLGGLQEAARKMRQARKWRDLERCYGAEFEVRGKVRRRIGTIRALENTCGDNGHHPHQHILGFLRGGVDVEAFTKELTELWLHAVAQVGRFASPKWGIRVEHTDAKIADYVAKWGKEPRWTAAHEMTKASSKAARGAGWSMSGLLELYLMTGDAEAGRRWREFAQAFKGHNQLRWSPGLRAVLLPDEQEKTDQEIVNSSEEDAVFLALLDMAAWRVVLGTDARYELLRAASSGDAGEIQRFLLSLGIIEGVNYGDA
jgi:hypothetical protein